MLKNRIISGFFIAVIVCLVLLFSHIPFVFNATISLLCICAIYELYKTSDFEDWKKHWFLTSLLAVVISFSKIPNNDVIILFLFLFAIMCAVYTMCNIYEIVRFTPGIYFLMSLIVTFFYNSARYIRDMREGFFILVFAVLITVITDIAAYFVGRSMGQNKLAPDISPNKTIEGAIGGAVVSSLVLMTVALTLNNYFVCNINFGKLMFYLVQASCVGQFGDLALSAIKRVVGIKDYGTIFPGHGGILDRFDSMMFVLPFTYLYFLCAGNVIF